ncbi:MAG: tellurite resistance TerB family protein [Planctomycetales bacterium]|nr:tellurite resistance TerB family protein [Planctomycetales bacterium]
MSLFDEVLGNDSGFEERPFGPQEAFAGVLLCASACDGHIADEEAQTLFNVLSKKRLYERLSSHQFGGMMDRLMGALKKSGPGKLLDKCLPAVPPELRETAFAVAVDIVLADGVVEDDEKTFIDDLMVKMEIDPRRAKTIVQVMAYKNQG